MPGGNRRRHHSKPSTSTAASVSNPLATIPPSELPLDIILAILKLLPVKSILRFKCVSKQWLSLLSTPKFVSIHVEETSKNPLNDSFIIHNKNKDELSLLNVNSTEREPISLFNPFYGVLKEMKLVGSVNGLVCLSCTRKAHMIILWNPAMNLYKPIRLSIPDKDTDYIALGFAYDSVDDDYKIIQIDRLKTKEDEDDLFKSRAKVYSASLDSWKTVQTDYPSVAYKIPFNVIATGIPYWAGLIVESNNLCRVLVYYDMLNGSFKLVPLPDQDFHFNKTYVEWKGNLGRIVCRRNFVDIWVYDEMALCWNKISSHGSIGSITWRPIQCSRDGLILVETVEEKLMLYDPVTDRIKEFCIPGAPRDFVEAVTYTESLVTIKGMEIVKEQYKDKS